MEAEKNIISSEAKLSAIAGVLFFAPFLKNITKSDFFSDYEKDFIKGYVKIGYVNIFFLIIVLLSVGLNFFLDNQVLFWISNSCSIVIYIISVLTIFACAKEIGMWMGEESPKQNIQHKGQLIKAYTPIMNFMLRFHKENYNMPYRWLKESILLRTLFIFGALLLGNSFGVGVLAFIVIRITLLLLNIDIIPLSVKRAINSLFSCNPGEAFAYIFSPIVSKIKKTDYETILQNRKQSYMQGQHFGVSILFQYILFVGLVFLLYRGVSFSVNHIVLFIAMLLRIIRLIVFYIHKRALLKIPILSEIVSLVFH